MKELSFDIMLDMIRAGQPFSYARYGDGEWNAILQKKPGGRNCDGHEYFQDLGEALRRVLESRPNYYLGLQRLATEQNAGNKLFDWLVAINKWTDNEIMHRASIRGRMIEFFETMKERRLIIVGNESLKDLFTDAIHVKIPEKNCWIEFAAIVKTIAGLIDENKIVLYCASMMSEVLIDGFKDRGLIQIDCGSAFDPYVGRSTRSYHKNLKLS